MRKLIRFLATFATFIAAVKHVQAAHVLPKVQESVRGDRFNFHALDVPLSSSSLVVRVEDTVGGAVRVRVSQGTVATQASHDLAPASCLSSPHHECETGEFGSCVIVIEPCKLTVGPWHIAVEGKYPEDNSTPIQYALSAEMDENKSVNIKSGEKISDQVSPNLYKFYSISLGDEILDEGAVLVVEMSVDTINSQGLNGVSVFLNKDSPAGSGDCYNATLASREVIASSSGVLTFSALSPGSWSLSVKGETSDDPHAPIDPTLEILFSFITRVQTVPVQRLNDGMPRLDQHLVQNGMLHYKLPVHTVRELSFLKVEVNAIKGGSVDVFIMPKSVASENPSYLVKREDCRHDCTAMVKHCDFDSGDWFVAIRGSSQLHRSEPVTFTISVAVREEDNVLPIHFGLPISRYLRPNEIQHFKMDIEHVQDGDFVEITILDFHQGDADVYVNKGELAAENCQMMSQRCRSPPCVVVLESCLLSEGKWYISVISDRYLNYRVATKLKTRQDPVLLTDGVSVSGTGEITAYTQYLYEADAVEEGHALKVSLSNVQSGTVKMYANQALPAGDSACTDYHWSTSNYVLSDYEMRLMCNFATGDWFISVVGYSQFFDDRLISYLLTPTLERYEINKVESGVPQHSFVSLGDYTQFKLEAFGVSLDEYLDVVVTNVRNGKVAIFVNRGSMAGEAPCSDWRIDDCEVGCRLLVEQCQFQDGDWFVGVKGIEEVTHNPIEFTMSITRRVGNLEVPTLVAVSPPVGSRSGGTSVLLMVLASLYSPTGDETCNFGDIVVDSSIVEWNAPHLIFSCIAPPMKDHDEVPIQVCFSADQCTDSSTFSYYSAPSISSISPSSGPESGGTIVTVIGSSFYSTDGFALKLRIGGDVITDIISISFNEFRFVTPPGSGAVDVAVAVAGTDFSNSNIQYSYYPDLNIGAVHPHVGPSLGFDVLVSGSGFHDSDQLECKIGDSIVKASFVSEREVTCRAPPAQSTSIRPVKVAVSLNAQQFGASTASIVYYTVSHMTPSSGPIAGDTVVTFSGAGLIRVPDEDAECKFGDSRVPASYQEGNAYTCHCPPVDAGGVVSADLTLNGRDFANRVLEFHYYSIESAFPTIGPPIGGTEVTISGSGFEGSSEVLCLFGGTERTQGSVVDGSTILCDAPPGEPGSRVSVEVSGNLRDFTATSGVHFSYYGLDVLAVSKVNPDHGTRDGGTEIVVKGSGYLDTDQLSCFFGQISVPASFVDEQTLRCTTPPGSGSVSVDVSLNGHDVTNSGEVFYYIDPSIRVSGLSPTFGPSQGGSTVTVRGGGFVEDGSLMCRFGATEAPAIRLVNEMTVQCVSPPGNGKVQVDVSVNGEDYTFSKSFFTYEDVKVSRVVPDRGPANGGTLVRVYSTGLHKAEDLRCKFGEMEVPADYASTDSDEESSLTCVSPPGFGTVDLEVSIDGGSTFSSSRHHYIYTTPHALVLSIEPPSGTKAGGTVVTAVGNGFVESDRLQCRFGRERNVPATFLDAEHVACVSPVGSGVVEFAVTNDGQKWSTKHIIFQYFDDEISLVSITPAEGPSTGGSIHTISGSGFKKSSLLVCMFFPLSDPGNRDGGWDFELGESGLAKFESRTKIMCQAPIGRGVVGLAVSNDGATFGPDILSFTYFDSEMDIDSLSPSIGPLSGDTMVTLSGSGFQSFGDPATLSCKFGSELVRATLMDDTLVTCLSPPVDKPGEVFVELSLDGGITFSKSNTKFLYYRTGDFYIASIYPLAGTNEGGTLVEIEGAGFVDTGANLMCKFGTEEVVASFNSKSSMSCVSPPGSGSVPFEVTKNGNDYTQSGMVFSYFDPSLVSVSSCSPSVGPSSGGTTLTLGGSNIFPSRNLGCRFIVEGGDYDGDLVGSAPGLFISGSLMTCSSPEYAGFNPVSSTQQVLVWVTLDGATFSKASVTFLYYNSDTFVVSSLSPSHAVAGFDTDVTVLGGGFLDSPDLVCSVSGPMFPSGNVGTKQRTVVVTGTFSSVDQIECRIPSGHGIYEVRVSLNGQDFTPNRLLFIFHEDAKASDVSVRSISPPLGPIRGGTDVVVSGGGFSDSAVYCVLQGIVVNGVVTDSSTIKCTSGPTEEEGRSEPFFVLLGGRVYMPPDGATWTYYNATVSQVTPSRGIAKGGDLVTLSGSGFVDGGSLMACSFDGSTVPVLRRSGDTVVCEAPAATRSDPSEDVIDANVAVCFNGQQCDEWEQGQYSYHSYSRPEVSIDGLAKDSVVDSNHKIVLRGNAKSSIRWFDLDTRWEMVTPFGDIEDLAESTLSLEIKPGKLLPGHEYIIRFWATDVGGSSVASVAFKTREAEFDGSWSVDSAPIVEAFYDIVVVELNPRIHEAETKFDIRFSRDPEGDEISLTGWHMPSASRIILPPGVGHGGGNVTLVGYSQNSRGVISRAALSTLSVYSAKADTNGPAAVVEHILTDVLSEVLVSSDEDVALPGVVSSVMLWLLDRPLAPPMLNIDSHHAPLDSVTTPPQLFSLDERREQRVVAHTDLLSLFDNFFFNGMSNETTCSVESLTSKVMSLALLSKDILSEEMENIVHASRILDAFTGEIFECNACRTVSSNLAFEAVVSLVEADANQVAMRSLRSSVDNTCKAMLASQTAGILPGGKLEFDFDGHLNVFLAKEWADDTGTRMLLLSNGDMDAPSTSVTIPSSIGRVAWDRSGLSSDDRPPPSRIRDTIIGEQVVLWGDEPYEWLSDFTVRSPVVDITLRDSSGKALTAQNLSNPIAIQFARIPHVVHNPDPNVTGQSAIIEELTIDGYSPLCSFLTFPSNSSETDLGYSTEGCIGEAFTSDGVDSVKCSFSHLTSFALVTQQPKPESRETASSFIEKPTVYVLGTAFIVFLIVGFVLNQQRKKRRENKERLMNARIPVGKRQAKLGLGSTTMAHRMQEAPQGGVEAAQDEEMGGKFSYSEESPLRKYASSEFVRQHESFASEFSSSATTTTPNKEETEESFFGTSRLAALEAKLASARADREEALEHGRALKDALTRKVSDLKGLLDDSSSNRGSPLRPQAGTSSTAEDSGSALESSTSELETATTTGVSVSSALKAYAQSKGLTEAEVLESDGKEFIHFLCHNGGGTGDGKTKLRTPTTFVNSSPAPFTVQQMLQSYSRYHSTSASHLRELDTAVFASKLSVVPPPRSARTRSDVSLSSSQQSHSGLVNLTRCVPRYVGEAGMRKLKPEEAERVVGSVTERVCEEYTLTAHDAFTQQPVEIARRTVHSLATVQDKTGVRPITRPHELNDIVREALSTRGNRAGVGTVAAVLEKERSLWELSGETSSPSTPVRSDIDRSSPSFVAGSHVNTPSSAEKKKRRKKKSPDSRKNLEGSGINDNEILRVMKQVSNGGDPLTSSSLLSVSNEELRDFEALMTQAKLDKESIATELDKLEDLLTDARKDREKSLAQARAEKEALTKNVAEFEEMLNVYKAKKSGSEDESPSQYSGGPSSPGTRS